jgi:hypothetical protein
VEDFSTLLAQIEADRGQVATSVLAERLVVAINKSVAEATAKARQEVFDGMRDSILVPDDCFRLHVSQGDFLVVNFFFSKSRAALRIDWYIDEALRSRIKTPRIEIRKDGVLISMENGYHNKYWHAIGSGEHYLNVRAFNEGTTLGNLYYCATFRAADFEGSLSSAERAVKEVQEFVEVEDALADAERKALETVQENPKLSQPDKDFRTARIMGRFRQIRHTST